MPNIITLVGGGGKTSFMCYLAKVMTDFGCKIVATTTTKLYRDGSNPGELVFAQTLEAGIAVIKRYQSEKKVLTLVKNISTFDTVKVEGFLPEFVDCLAGQLPDTMFIVEGDGAAGKPLKGHQEFEPVIPQETKILLPVVGIDVLGKLLSEESVHRVQRIIKLTGQSYKTVIETDLITSLLLSRAAYLRNCPKSCLIIPVINKVATSLERKKALRLADAIIELNVAGVKGVILGNTRQAKFTYLTKKYSCDLEKVLKLASNNKKNVAQD